ncbi:MAG: hypothetical protein Q8O16_01240 [Dehalococcoidia bacterium]|nr:hypothetical protein [Dehalococcoidia bacterium]
MANRDANLSRIREWEYCYCKSCDRMRYSSELEATDTGIRCTICGGYDFDAPGWTHCPYERGGAVKCPRAGKGIVRGEHALECVFHCIYRKSL